ncbi:MAG: hypothetical protein J6112_07910, partial [Clostridia bacterium]|nr:hypothetical protein [Clostridia bacterium]
MKRIASVVLALLILLSLTGLTVLYSCADDEDEEKTLTGVTISPEGILAFDEYPGTVTYWLGINGGFLPVTSGEPLDRIEKMGTYFIKIEASGIKPETGEEGILAYWEGGVEYDGSTFKQLDYSPDPYFPQVPETPGEIANVELTPEGKLTFDEDPIADYYDLVINGDCAPVSSGDVISRVEKPGRYIFKLIAYFRTISGSGDLVLAKWA